MKILERLRNRPAPTEASGTGPSGPGSEEPPIAGYDRLNEKQVGTRLHELSQVELAAVETYEREHQDRPAVLRKLRYMRTGEPLPDYDSLSAEQIVEALVGANAQTVKAVRDYERKFAHRAVVLAETARVLPSSPASAEEDRVREEKAARLAEGYAVRKSTAEEM